MKKKNETTLLTLKNPGLHAVGAAAVVGVGALCLWDAARTAIDIRGGKTTEDWSFIILRAINGVTACSAALALILTEYRFIIPAVEEEAEAILGEFGTSLHD